MTSLDARFACLADPTRRAILMRLAEGEATVQELTAPFAISQPAVSRHLRVLEEAGLIETRVQGAARPRRLRPGTMDELWEWMQQYRAAMERSYARLDRVLDDLMAKEAQDGKPDH